MNTVTGYPSGPNGHATLRRNQRKLGSPRSRNILLVDDEDSVREFMAMVLESDGFTVLRARHSVEALFFNGEFPGPIHLLLTDFRMDPYPNGFELARQVRASRPDIRVIYASGFADHDELRGEVDAARSRFLAKPFSPGCLLECIRQALGIAA